MTKLNKQYYYTKGSGKKINCYHILLPRRIVEKAFNSDDELNIYESYGKIIIVKKWYCTCMECGHNWESGEDEGLGALCPKCHCADVDFEINNGEL